MKTRAYRFVLGAAALSSSACLVACGETAPPTPVELPPIVGSAELPLAFRNDGNAGSGALRIEASTGELRVNGQPVYTGLARGAVPASEESAEGLTQLLAAVRAAPASQQANLTFAGMVPYETAVRVIQTLNTAGYRNIALAVRAPGSALTSSGWMTLSGLHTAPATGPVTFEGGTRPWGDFTARWADMYDACRAGNYIDCDGSPVTPSVGGEVQVVLWSRGQGMQMRFNQVNAPVVEAPAAGGHVALIEGVPAPAEAPAEEAPPPDTNGVFSFRYEEATRTETTPAGAVQPNCAISETARPVCGAAVCQTIVEADGDTPWMRVVSFIGAAFPNGSTAPNLALRLPE